MAFDSIVEFPTAGGGGGAGSTVITDYAISAEGGGVWTVSNYPAAAEWMGGAANNARTVFKADTSDATSVRLLVRKEGTAGNSTAKMRLVYSSVNPGSTFVSGDWLNPGVGGAEVSVAINATHAMLDSGFQDLRDEAKGDLYWTVLPLGGDGVADPVFGTIHMQVTSTVSGGTSPGGPSATYHAESFEWQGGNFNDAGASATYWPDGGVGGLPNLGRWFRPPIFGDFSSWAPSEIRLELLNVDGSWVPLPGNVSVSLRTTANVTVAAITIASGTAADSPSNALGIMREAAAEPVTVSGADRLRWQVDDAPTGNPYIARATVIGVLS